MSQPTHEVAALVVLPNSDYYPGGFDPLQLRIYGLTLFERTLKALELGGCSHMLILSSRPSSEIESWLNQRKNWRSDIGVVHSKHPPSDQEKWLRKLSFVGTKGVVLVSEPIVFDPKLIPWLRQQNEQPATVASGLLTYFPKEKIEKEIQIKDSHEYPLALLPCQYVKSETDKREVKRLLRKSLVKTTDGWVSRHLNRPVSIIITRILAHSSVTPNQFTLFTGLLSILTAWLLAQGPYWGFMLGALLFHLTSILDGVDGELARLKFMSSPFGQWLDTLVDNSSYVLALVGYLVGLYKDGVTSFEKLAGISTLVFTALALGNMYFYLKRFNKGGSLLNIEYGYKKGNKWSDKLLRWMAPLGKRDLFALIFFLLGVVGKLHLALAFVAILTVVLFALSIQAHIDTSRQLRS